MPTIKLALDWTPNTNHTGFFVAREKGFYKENFLDVEFLSPADDNYATTPAKKVELGEADLAIVPSESIISYNTKSEKVQARAVATLLRKDVSAIVVLKGSDIRRPRDLDGKVYASYHARYEDAIVRQMIKNDGGKGEIEIIYPEKLGIWDTLLDDKADATWVFLNWEGIAAEVQGVELRVFKMKKSGIPYGYSPVIMTTEERIKKNRLVINAFLEATKEGFLYAKDHPKESVEILAPYVSEKDRGEVDLLKSQQYTGRFYGDEENWGYMDPSRVQDFINWLMENGLEKDIENAADWFTNEFC